MKSLRIAIVIYIFAILLTSCAGAAPAGQSAQLEGPTWVLTGINHGDILVGTMPTIQFEDGQVSGNASCNSFGSNYKVDGETIRFEALYMTEMYCMEPEGAMDQEMAYLAILGEAQRFEISEGVLTINAQAGQTLTFDQQ